MMDWTKSFQIKNVAGGRVVVGAFSFGDGEYRDINPLMYSAKAIDRLKLYHLQGLIEATNDFTPIEKTDDFYSVSNVSTVKNAEGEQRNHVVYDPSKEKAIKTEAIDTNKAVSVENLVDNSQAVGVAYSAIDKIEAKEVLEQHWRKVESEIKKISSTRKLELYLEVAVGEGMAVKKIEMIKERLSELSTN